MKERHVFEDVHGICFFVYGHLVNGRCDAHACLAGVSTARGVLGLVLPREMLTNLSKTWYEKHCI